MATKKSIIESISLYSSLSTSWSGYGSPTPSEIAIELAIKFIKTIHTADADSIEFSPSLDGGVDIVHNNGNAWFSALFRNSGIIQLETNEDLHIDKASFDEVCEMFGQFSKVPR